MGFKYMGKLILRTKKMNACVNDGVDLRYTNPRNIHGFMQNGSCLQAEAKVTASSFKIIVSRKQNPSEIERYLCYRTTSGTCPENSILVTNAFDFKDLSATHLFPGMKALRIKFFATAMLDLDNLAKSQTGIQINIEAETQTFDISVKTGEDNKHLSKIGFVNCKIPSDTIIGVPNVAFENCVFAAGIMNAPISASSLLKH